MVVVLPAQDVDVQRHASCDGERVEDVREHLRGEVADLLALEAELDDAVRPVRQVDDGARERLVEGRVR